MRRFGIPAVLIAFILISIGAAYAFEAYNTVNIQEAEYEIVDMTVGFTKSSNASHSVFTVDLGEGKHYTLPAITTSYVRDYYIGDTLPVIITEYRDGTHYIEINKDAL